MDKFPSLTHLDLSRCAGGVTVSLLAPIASLSNLRELSLSGCDEVVDGCIPFLTALTRLRSLSLAGCWRLTDSALITLAQPTIYGSPSSPQLTTLDLSGCTGLSSVGLQLFLRGSGGHALSSLYLEDCVVDDGHPPNRRVVDNSILAEIAALPSLTDLNLAGNSVIDAIGVAHLTSLSSLESLDLGGCSQLGDAAIGQLSKLTALRRLDLSVTAVTDACLSRVLLRLCHLRSLQISSCDGLAGHSIRRFGETAPQLEELSLRSNVSVTDSSLQGLTALTGLRSLDLGYCVAISDQGLSFLSHLQKLESLSLSGCLWVHLASMEMPPVAVQSVSNHSDSSLTTTDNKTPSPRISPAAHPVTQLQSLRDLDLSGSGVRDEGVCQLVRLPRLTEVDLSSCHEISSTSLVTLLLCSGSLTSCHYDDCERVDSREVRTLLRASAALRLPIEISRNHCTQPLFQPLTAGMQAAQA